jgi:hypothetical protein
MAKISQIQGAIQVCGEAGVTPFIWGHRGLGKSSLCKQLAAKLGVGFIDMRCSQLEGSDIRGLPDRLEGRTVYYPPADLPVGDWSDSQVAEYIGDLPDSLEGERQFDRRWAAAQPHFQRGILFLDEINRAQDDVLQAAFQLVLDKKVGQYTLPPGWWVVAAGNFQEGYTTNGFNDPAFLDRFCHLTLSTGEPTLAEWVDYMALQHGENACEIIEFASQNVKHLDGDVKGELGFSVLPSRRSWEAVARVDKLLRGELSHLSDVRLLVLSGLIGQDLALSFTKYTCPVKPRDILDKGVKAFASKLKSLERGQLLGLMWGLVSFCKDKMTDEKTCNVCLDFAEFMLPITSDKDIVVAFCRSLAGQDSGRSQNAKAAVITNPKLANLVAEFNRRSKQERSFVDRLVERPVLQEILARAAYGRDDADAPVNSAKKK